MLENKLYYMLNKPRGYITARKDEVHHTVMEFFPPELSERLFPVGRLDKDTEGLLLFTDDGQFDQPIAESAYRAAREALAGSDPTGGAIYYFNPATATSKWIWSRPLMVVIGSHRFCA